MSGDDIDFEILNAYVDGELGHARRAEIAAAAARDPAVAGQIAALSRLKSGVAGSVETAGHGVTLPPHRAAWPRWQAAVAASIVAAVIGAAVALYGPSWTAGGAVNLAWLTGIHRSWGDGGPAAKPIPKTGLALASLATVGPGAYVPDLSAARLSVAAVRPVRGPAGGDALLVAYRGTRGCKVSLIILKSAPWRETQPAPLAAETVRGYYWRAGDLAYVIVAEGMAGPRFDLIAAGVHRASQERLPLDGDTRTALARSRAESPPCAA